MKSQPGYAIAPDTIGSVKVVSDLWRRDSKTSACIRCVRILSALILVKRISHKNRNSKLSRDFRQNKIQTLALAGLYEQLCYKQRAMLSPSMSSRNAFARDLFFVHITKQQIPHPKNRVRNDNSLGSVIEEDGLHRCLNSSMRFFCALG